MTSSLVGSEMCIRDRWYYGTTMHWLSGLFSAQQDHCTGWMAQERLCYPVSYTHLTLPTICSV
eukprot:5248932-Prorocentrum_lima.AAC.1